MLQSFRLTSLLVLTAEILLLNLFVHASEDCQPLPLVRRSVPGVTSRSSTVTVVSLNMAKETRLTRIQEGLSRMQVSGPDIFLLQEVQAPPGEAQGPAEQLAERLDFSLLYLPANVWKNGSKEGLAIISRYPLEDPAVIRLPSFDLIVNNRCRMALAATAVTPLGRVRLFNVHLDTRISTKERLEQLSPVLSRARGVSGPCLVGGDFNTSDLQWLGRIFPLPSEDQEIQVRRYFEETGFRTPFVDEEATFDFMGLRLDSIYVRGLGWTAWGIDDIDFSDHRAVWITLRVEGTRNPPERSSQEF